MAENRWDVIVIGAGAVGENIADRAVQGGLSVVLVESELVGGECSYWACMPSKALIRSGLALRAAQRVDGTAQAVTGDIDVAALLARRDSFTSNWDDAGQVRWVEKAGIDLRRGHARLDGAKRVIVTDDNGDVTTLNANHAVVVATGSDPKLPDISGLVDAQPWTPREATSVKEVPESFAIIGGGVVGVEMATAYLDLGSKVTLFARSGLLNGQEDFAGDLVAKALRARGATIVTASPTRVKRTAHGVEIETETESFTASEILIATGRTARTSDIGLDTVGLPVGDWLSVDDTMLVHDTDWLYAVGDVNHRALLTHQGKYQARAAGDVIVARAKGEPVDDAPWGSHVATADHGAVPQVTFTDPEVASVGIMSADAQKQGIDVQIVDYNIGWVAGASLQADNYEGQARLVIDRELQVIVGATFVGQDVAELLHSATIAIVGEVPIARLWHAVPSYPTISEVWLRLLEAVGRP
ncbi:dihydrolipoamide dehydrogenase [Rhodoglobus vestalii]|uniref:Dihydrolipoamide dehydrogenase n=1 Tax=Rhodoglobus vestalii TaxID=193384 RepID=A0A8H2K4L1_9MICO|nr:NAD(P)/FAD-dependent oxidoreductase [Rhodoglobus vestalii]TQO19070.1 dihydrolipoamide dehydrogenase [Rhodoglobus vestalii]